MKIITTILFILSSVITFAQGGAMADLKFEEAEIAFNNQDYETTIKKLDEFDKLLGSIKDKSLYLRIISQDKLFEPSKLYENESNFNLLSSLRKNTSAYLKAMESNGLDERYREVYAINEKIVQYPKDKVQWKINKDKIENDFKNYLLNIRQKLSYLPEDKIERGIEIVLKIEKNMVSVLGGNFAINKGLPDSKTIAVKDFKINKFEISLEEYRFIMNNFNFNNISYHTSSVNDSYGILRDFKKCVTDSEEFIKKLNWITGKSYRLPTDIEWEFAASGGNFTKRYLYSGSNDYNEIAWYYKNSSGKKYNLNKKFEKVYNDNGEYIEHGKIQRAGLKKPNELELYDMNGNVSEICVDTNGKYCYKGGSIGDDVTSLQFKRYNNKVGDEIFGFRIAL